MNDQALIGFVVGFIPTCLVLGILLARETKRRQRSEHDFNILTTWMKFLFDAAKATDYPVNKIPELSAAIMNLKSMVERLERNKNDQKSR